MENWEHKDETWFWDAGQRQFEVEEHNVYWTLRLWASKDASPCIIDKQWHLPRLSPDANDSQKLSFNIEVEKINKEFSKILRSQLEFSEWLNLQTKGGWEVFKISRRETGTWCVFRRRSEWFGSYSNESKDQCSNPLIRFAPIIGLAVGLFRR